MPNPNETIKGLQKDVEKATAQLELATAAAQEAREARESQSERVAELETQVADLQTSVDARAAELAEKVTHIEELEAQLKEAKAAVTDFDNRVAASVAAATGQAPRQETDADDNGGDGDDTGDLDPNDPDARAKLFAAMQKLPADKQMPFAIANGLLREAVRPKAG